jgi:hypothetical protein
MSTLLSLLSWRSDLKKGILISLFAYAIVGASSLQASQSTQGTAFVFTEVLEWQVREGGADLIGELITPIGTANPSVKLLDAPFKWNSGFRIGGGYRSTNDWDNVVYYTSYNTQANNQIIRLAKLTVHFTTRLIFFGR